MSDAHMVEQVIKYSDGTETSIKYRGVIVDGVLISEKVEEGAEVAEESAPEAPAETVETPEITEEVVAESVEESA